MYCFIFSVQTKKHLQCLWVPTHFFYAGLCWVALKIKLIPTTKAPAQVTQKRPLLFPDFCQTLYIKVPSFLILTIKIIFAASYREIQIQHAIVIHSYSPTSCARLAERRIKPASVFCKWLKFVYSYPDFSEQ